MFPGAGAQVYYNEAGEPVGWDYPSYGPEYCDVCGYAPCACDDYDPEDEDA